jgi:hypothetical protein
MAHIRRNIDEMETLKLKIKQNNANLKRINDPLRQRLKTLENEVQNYIKENNLPGVRYNGKVILLKTKEKKPLKDQKQRREDLIRHFSEMGFDDPESLYDDVDRVSRKDGIIVDELHMKKYQ